MVLVQVSTPVTATEIDVAQGHVALQGNAGGGVLGPVALADPVHNEIIRCVLPSAELIAVAVELPHHVVALGVQGVAAKAAPV